MESDIRQRICRVISLMPTDCSTQDVCDNLDPLFGSAFTMKFETKVTPLIVACDKGNSACVNYLLKKSKEGHKDLIGLPFDVSNDSENTAIHHAAMSGCETAIANLNQLGESILSLASVRNSHGDTPLMMAATNGHLKFLRTFHELAVRDHGTNDVLRIFSVKNDANDSCLSLACCHGMTEVFDFLLSAAALESDVLEICRLRLKKMESALRSNPDLMNQHKRRYDDVKDCVNKLEARIARMAEETARELLNEEESQVKERIRTKKKKHVKKRGRKIQMKPTKDHLVIDAPSPTISESGEPESETMRLTKLSDGKVAVIVKGENLEEQRLLISGSTGLKEQSVNEMFRERFKAASLDVDAVMNSLCLDVSQLLYTPHQMALDLSPSQLDAVQEILTKQLLSIEEARAIQNRMHNTSQE